MGFWVRLDLKKTELLGVLIGGFGCFGCFGSLIVEFGIEMIFKDGFRVVFFGSADLLAVEVIEVYVLKLHTEWAVPF